MSSITSLHQIPSFITVSGSGKVLSEATIMRLLALGIDPSTVTSESQAQILIAQAEAASKQSDSQHGGKQQEEKHKSELQQNIFNAMDMVSLSNKLILGL